MFPSELIFCAVLLLSPVIHGNEQTLPYDRTSIEDCGLRFYKQTFTKVAFPAGGQPVLLREFAHIAAIGWINNGSKRWLCAGSLIWENFILTAAHCAADENNNPPDIARFGDININSDGDDEFAQELEIVAIIRHPQHRFSSTYYDIALMQLERGVVVTDTVAPTCLWLDDEIRFPKLLAAGWGRTGVGEEQTDILLKVELALVSNENCSNYYAGGDRSLRDGLMDHQLCAGDEKMDTCPGDSGGPLHVKLFDGWKLIPFLVGVTSFGKACGLSVPGVYVKVSSFGDWIIETLQQHGEHVSDYHFQPTVCTNRYQKFREYKPDVVTVDHGVEMVDWHNIYVAYEGSDYIVNFGWPITTGPVDSDCFGTLVEPNVVVTLAECILSTESLPTQIILTDANIVDIAEIVVHPLYNSSSNPYYNNIAVVKLKTFAKILPYCVWYGESIPDRQLLVTGYTLSTFLFLIELHYSKLITRVWKQSQDQCNLPRQYSERLPQGLLSEHICYENQPFFVPGGCISLPGSPIERNGGKYIYIDGIHLFGRDCGYGEPAVGVRLSAHKAWLESVLLPQPQRSEALVHVDPDLDVSDTCRYADRTTGTCTPQQNCPAIHTRVQNKQQLLFCKRTSVVCCPEKATNLETTAIEREFNECEERYRHLRTNRQENTTHIVEIGWQETDKVKYDCYGYLISTRGVVTSASCVLEKTKLPNLVRLGGLGFFGGSQTIRIEKVETYPNYNKTIQEKNIAIVKLSSPVEPTQNAYPGCLWQNVSHSPLIQQVLDFASMYNDPIHPMYKSDCEIILNRSFDQPESICMNPGVQSYNNDLYHFDLQLNFSRNNEDFIYDRCYSPGSPIVWKHVSDEDVYVEYLVNVYSHGSCDSLTPRIVNRMAAYIDWFKKVL
ncbi:uncharacterized protein LOC126567607 [Anopheles maculipalpis]|uniref:uncharacterized protein LOC126567607 n=1 Tax=Anopheles maculipalpis TaxID=1496333 RepID=UPI00215927CF|nr:uncharacterized protein LOC126567607 [Anopheles maculipalpis]